MLSQMPTVNLRCFLFKTGTVQRIAVEREPEPARLIM